jgi:heme exporter protein A
MIHINITRVSLLPTFSSLMSPLISAENLTCIREERILFEQLTLQVNAGDIVQIEGANGTGKTSLLRILAGLSQPYDGDVIFNQSKITQCRETFYQNLLYIGHLTGVKGELTAQENLEFSLTLHNLSAEMAEQTLSEVNLLGFEDALASHLSAGQHRRIALARLWQSKAPIWILDEPFTSIDKLGVRNLEQLFLRHVNNGGCIILTTHQDLSFPKERLKQVVLTHQFSQYE